MFLRMFFSVIFITLTGVFIFPAVPIEKINLGEISITNARFRLIAAAESYIGTPYRYGGTDSRGVDCSGLIFLSFRDSLKITVPRTAASLYAWTQRIPDEQIRPGDLVFFTTTGLGVSHVGIFTGEGRFIHAPSEYGSGVTYSLLDEPYWKRTYAGAGRALPWDEAVDKPLGLRMGLSGSGFELQTAIKGLFNTTFNITVKIEPEWDSTNGVYRFNIDVFPGSSFFSIGTYKFESLNLKSLQAAEFVKYSRKILSYYAD